MNKEERIFDKTKLMPLTRRAKYLYALSLLSIQQKKFNKRILHTFLSDMIEINDISRFMEIYLKLVEEAYRYDEEKKEVVALVVEFMPPSIKYLYSQSDMEPMHIEIFFKKLEMIFQKYGISERRLYQEKFKYYVGVGLWEKSFKCFSKWMNADMDKNSASLGEEEADRAYYYYLINERETGDAIYENVENGILRADQLRTESLPRILRYRVDQGKMEQTIFQARNLYRFTQKKEKYLILNAEIMKIVFLYNEMMAYEIWRREYKNYLTTQNEYDKFHFGVGTYLLYRRFSQMKKTSKHTRKMKKIIDEMYTIQEEYDKKNKNTHFMDELLFWEHICISIEEYQKQQRS